MDQIEKVAEQLTDHIKEFCYINNSPAISPNGEWIAFLSERSDYFDVYLMSTIDGKVHKRLIKGQRSGNFEELHWLRPGITWAPDGKSIALCAKTGKNDALFIVDVESTKVLQMLEFESDGMFSPSWSPDSNKIALVFVKNGKSDLAYVDINTGNLSMITSDIFDDADPSWSSDSRRLLFTSNRNNKSESTSGVPDHRFTDYNYQRFNIFEINIFDKNIKQITDDDYLERTPIWSQNEQEILFISNKNRVYNIYSFNVNTGNSKPISNFVTGALQPSISKQTQAICFSSYFNMGYDIFLINEPLDNNTFAIPLEVPDPGKIEQNQSEELGFGNLEVDYSHFVFISEDDLKQQNADDFPDSSQVIKRTKDENGSYTSNDYEVSFSPDIVFVNAAYSPYYNMQGSGMILFTDVLGNHQLYLSLDLNRYVEWSNIYVNYGYQARRVSVSTGAYHYAYLYSGDHVYWQDQNIGLFVSLGYPLSRFNRIDFGVSYLSIIRGVYDWDNLYHANKPGISELQAVLPHIAYVHDTSVWKSSIEPANGGRWRFDVTGSPGIAGTDGNRLEFITFSADWRQYFRYKRDYSFAIRLSGAASEGKNPQRFYMGGVLNWFNPRWDNLQSSAEINDINDIYFASWVTPIRGVGYYNQVGSKYLLSNIEFRFPFIRYLVLGWPLPAFFQNVRGAIFTDVGTAWTSSNLMNNSWTRGSGFGIRLDLGIFPLQWDVAWSPDPSSNMGPRYYFSINTGF
ncbi:PD40 domain-containing protein [bacterium]|nr:PD40 domain-containing protein [bacterium]